MRLRNQAGFTVLEGLIVVLLLAVMGFAGWFVWQDRTANGKTANSSTLQTQTQQAGPVSLDESRLPEGWTVQSTTASSVGLANSARHCTVDASLTTDTMESNSPDIDHEAELIRSLESKGYIVTREPRVTFVITTPDERHKLDAMALSVEDTEGSSYQQIAFVSNHDYFARVQLICNDAVDIESARRVLDALVLKL